MRPYPTHLVVHGLAEKNGKCSLVQEKRGFWNLPRGSVEKGETLLEAINREMEEEIGVICQPKLIYKIMHRISAGSGFDGDIEEILRILYFFVVEPMAGLAQKRMSIQYKLLGL